MTYIETGKNNSFMDDTFHFAALVFPHPGGKEATVALTDPDKHGAKTVREYLEEIDQKVSSEGGPGPSHVVVFNKGAKQEKIARRVGKYGIEWVCKRHRSSISGVVSTMDQPTIEA